MGPFRYSLHVRLLPYIEQKNIYNRADFSEVIYAPGNVPAIGADIGVLHCPSDAAPHQARWPAAFLAPVYGEDFTVG